MDLSPIASRLAGLPLPGVVSVYVFGSRTQGREHRESDVDIGVLLSRSRHPTRHDRFEARLDLLRILSGIAGDAPLDLVILNDAPPELGRHIVTRGRRILSSDDEADHAFVRDVQLRAADLAPFLRRFRRRKLEGLAS